jgi:hypothetical protein
MNTEATAPQDTLEHRICAGPLWPSTIGGYRALSAEERAIRSAPPNLLGALRHRSHRRVRILQQPRSRGIRAALVRRDRQSMDQDASERHGDRQQHPHAYPTRQEDPHVRCLPCRRSLESKRRTRTALNKWFRGSVCRGRLAGCLCGRLGRESQVWLDYELPGGCGSSVLSGRVCMAPERGGQVSIHAVPSRRRPRVIRRRRFSAAARWCSQWSLRATPR